MIKIKGTVWKFSIFTFLSFLQLVTSFLHKTATIKIDSEDELLQFFENVPLDSKSKDDIFSQYVASIEKSNLRVKKPMFDHGDVEANFDEKHFLPMRPKRNVILGGYSGDLIPPPSEQVVYAPFPIFVPRPYFMPFAYHVPSAPIPQALINSNNTISICELNAPAAADAAPGILPHLIIQCQSNQRIHIITANFGRLDANICQPLNTVPPPPPPPAPISTNCYTPNSLSTVQTQCENQQTCTIPVHSPAFGITPPTAPDTPHPTDPCPGTSKYLTVTYVCENTF